MKKLFYSALFLIAPNLHSANNPLRYVQISTNAVTQQTGAFNVVGGSITTLNAVRISSSGTTGLAITGTRTNDSAAAGDLGEYVSSGTFGTGQGRIMTSGAYSDLGLLALTPGDWNLSGFWYFDSNGGKMTDVVYAITTTAGNSGTGTVAGSNTGEFNISNTSFSFVSPCIPIVRATLTTTTTYYLKANCTFTGTACAASGILNARRIR